jgi:outer membrane immunogenic protein
LSPAGVLAGGQIGFNWQSGAGVIGVEADLQGTGQKDTACLHSCFTPPANNIITTQNIDWLATLRGRVGYATRGWLWYVTGGGAAAQIKTNVAANLLNEPFVGNADFSDLKMGWVLGLGMETQWTGNWSWKFEYLYADLGTVTSTFGLAVPGGPATSTTTSQIRDHVIRAGVNYRFGGLGPVAAAY